jgi:hypothetical protein
MRGFYERQQQSATEKRQRGFGFAENGKHANIIL